MISEKSWKWEEAVSDWKTIVPVDNSDSLKVREEGVMNGAPPWTVNLLNCHSLYLFE